MNQFSDDAAAEQIEIQELVIQEFVLPSVEGDPETCIPGGAFARGHHEPAAFLLAVRAYLEETWGPRCAEDTLAEITADQISHLYWREEPVEGEDAVLFTPCERADPKGYAVTRVSWYEE